MADASWRGLFLFRFDRPQISVVHDYALVYRHVGRRSSGLFSLLCFVLIVVVHLGIHDHVLKKQQRLFRQLRSLYVQGHVYRAA